MIDNLDLANKLKSHPMWDEFDARCIACGACTVACSTCTCFETTDIIYTQNGKAGERRRTCSSCMVDGFDRMAGGACFRHKISEKYREISYRPDVCGLRQVFGKVSAVDRISRNAE